jgi:hypothetical protein
LCWGIKGGGVCPNGDPVCQAFSPWRQCVFHPTSPVGKSIYKQATAKSDDSRSLLNSLIHRRIDLSELSPLSRGFHVVMVPSLRRRTAGETGASNLLSVRCCQVGSGRYSPPQLDHLTSKPSSLGASRWSKQTNKAAQRVGRPERQKT